MRQKILEYFAAYRVPYNEGMIRGLEKLIAQEICLTLTGGKSSTFGMSIEEAQKMVDDAKKKLDEWYEGKI